MTEKISIFDVEISCIKAKEAMMQAIGFMKGDSVNTIELVSMESLMKEHENPEWKKKVSMQDLVLPGSVEILEAAKTDDARLLRETDNKLFLRMFLKYLQKNHHKIYLLAASQEELVKAEEGNPCGRRCRDPSGRRRVDRCRQDPWNSECSQWLRGRLYFISPSIAGAGRFY